MITQKSVQMDRCKARDPERLGTISYLLIFIWSIAVVMLTPAKYLVGMSLLSFFITAIVYPRAYRSLFRSRLILMIMIISIPPMFFLGEIDSVLMGIAYSSLGLENSIQILMRVLVMVVSVQGFTNKVDLSTIAGLFERFGLQGLGFSMGVALNLLPSLQTASINTWHSLWMRGGLRKNRWRGIRLLFVTVITNTLRRTEEISLAAEGRAFSPEQSYALPLRKGSLDIAMIIFISLMTIGLIVIL